MDKQKVDLEMISKSDYIKVLRQNIEDPEVIELNRNEDGYFYNIKGNGAIYRDNDICNFINHGMWKLQVIKNTKKEDLINKPSHYHSGGIDVFAFAESQCTTEELRGFYKINIFKYLARAEKKNGLEDYEKAERYLEELMKLVRKNQ